MGGWFGLWQEEENDRCRDQADDCIHDEEQDIGFCDEQSCHSRGDDDCHIEYHADDAIAFGAFVLRKQVGDHGFMCGSANTGKCANDDRNSDENSKRGSKSHTEGAERGKHEAEDDHTFASHAVGQCAADGASYKSRNGEDREYDAHSGHADLKFLCEIQSKEWIEHEPAEAVNEHDDVINPKSFWIFVINFFKDLLTFNSLFIMIK